MRVCTLLICLIITLVACCYEHDNGYSVWVGVAQSV